jgi:2-amino-4-hydroxy-6-hydroxymethyldihydropteridine diphosphokinase
VTHPRDDDNQPFFVNAVLKGRFQGVPLELLARLQEIELRYGRLRDPERPKGPRSLDIDILLFGDSKVNLPELKIPHPRMKERKFALVPLLELDPLIAEPGTGRRYADCTALLEEQGIYFLSLKDYSDSLAWEG